jgi:hypothetical protein
MQNEKERDKIDIKTIKKDREKVVKGDKIVKK